MRQLPRSIDGIEGRIELISALKDVLVILPSAEIGGAERHSILLGRELHSHGVHTTLVSTEGFFRNNTADLSGLNLLEADVAWYDEATYDDNFHRQRDLITPIVNSIKPEVAIVPLPWPSYGQGVQHALSALAIPHLSISHLAPRLIDPSVRPRSSSQDMSLDTRSLSRWAGVSSPIARRIEHLFGLPRGEVAVVENGIDVHPLTREQREVRRHQARDRLHIARSDKIVLVAGRLDEAKGSDIVPVILDTLHDIDVTVILAGEGRLRPMLEEARGRSDGRLRLLGQISNVREWMEAADMLLLPSRLEGWPYVFMEAAAVRCPVVATDVAMECFGAEAPLYARLVIEDDVGGLSQAVRETLNNPQDTVSCTERAYERVRLNNTQQMLARYFSILRLLRAGRSADAGH